MLLTLLILESPYIYYTSCVTNKKSIVLTIWIIYLFLRIDISNGVGGKREKLILSEIHRSPFP